MSDSSFKTIRNNVIATVIGGTILLAVPVLRGCTFALFKWIWSLLIWCWNALLKSYALPGWAWLIILGFALIGIIRIILSFREETTLPEYHSYVEGTIFGLKWRWRWNHNETENLWSYCPTCDGELVYNDSSRYGLGYSTSHETIFICENCSNSVVGRVKGGNKSHTLGAVNREIRRRIRTNEYKKALTSE